MGGTYDGSLIYDTKINTEGFEEGTKKIKQEAKTSSNDVKKSLEATRDSLSGINKVAKAVALSTAAIGAGVLSMGISYNSQIEQYTAGFTTMLGSAEKANKVLGDLKNFAASTPFELTDLANASTTLLAFGEDVEQLMPDLKMLGDISLGNAEKFKGLALVFGQVQSQGRLMGQDLLQMINQGFNPLQIISEKTGKSVATLKDEMAKGQITFEMVADAMKTATSEGGQFYNAMETQSKTLSGQWSTLKDNVTALTGEIASDISENLTEDVLPQLINMVEELTEMWEDGRLQDYIGDAATAIVTFGAAIAALNIILFVNDMAQLTNGVKNYTTATKAGAAAQKLMNAELLHNPYAIALAAVVALTAGIITYAATHKSVGDQISESIKDISEAHDEAVASIEKTKNAEIASAEVAKTYKDELYDLDKQLKSGTLTQDEANAAIEDFKTVAGKLEEIIPDITDYLYDETGEINLQKAAIDKLCDAYYELVVAKATASAAEKLIGQTAEDIAKQKQAQIKAHKEAEDARKQIAAIPMKTTYTSTGRAYRSYDILDSWKVKGLEGDIKDAQKAWAKAEEEIRKYTEEQEANKELLKQTEAEVRKLIDANGDLTKSNEEVEKSTDTNTTTQTNAVKKQTKETSQEFEKQYKNLKRSLDRELISRADYYKQLENLRDEYFAKDTDEWLKYTEELEDFKEDTFDGYLDALSDFKDDALATMQELSNKQKSLAESLQAENFTYESGTINGEDFLYLADLDSENGKLARYNVMLEQLYEKRADLPAKVTEALQGMDLDEGMKYVTAMLKATDDEFNEYIDDLKRNEELTGKVSTRLISEEYEEAKRILEEKFGELPEDFFGVGGESAENFGEGFRQKISEVAAMMREAVMAEMSAMVPASVVYGATGAMGSTTNTYTNNYTFNSSRDTTTQQLKAASDASTMARLRGGN